MKKPIIEWTAKFKNSETKETKTTLFYLPPNMCELTVSYRANLEFSFEVDSLENWTLSDVHISNILTK